MILQYTVMGTATGESCYNNSTDMSMFKKVDLNNEEFKSTLIKSEWLITSATENNDVQFERLYCNPNITDSEIVTKVIDCFKNYKIALKPEERELVGKLDSITRKECYQNNNDMSRFSKVDLSNQDFKYSLVEACDIDYDLCLNHLAQYPNIQAYTLKWVKQCQLNVVCGVREGLFI
ncbi:unnamed protein product [Medioppia subpectinata]|uniref:Uncharacterized protein n=1 Tax=Medioppia subpectinata TaxID=1979941 RepID=A0A7R9PUZ5_9ACAR|nr:unnamed protein product [Medioppia subpectinata]CAG2101326.1 unnamed protein product [Medioppia subpectinata]